MLRAVETSEETSSMAKTPLAPLGVDDEALETAESALASAFEADEPRLLFPSDVSSVFEALLVALDALEDAFEVLEDAFDTVEPAMAFSRALFRKGTMVLEADETSLLLKLDDTSSI